jgi:hypothetical protein
MDASVYSGMKEGGGAKPISCNPLFLGRLFCAAPQKRARRGKREKKLEKEEKIVISNY